MSAVIVVFPPGGGGNHLRNIVVSCYTNSTQITKLYSNYRPKVHASTGNNLQRQQVENALVNQDQIHVLHGHFGEVMSFQNQIRNITNKKFIILSPDTKEDRKLLLTRRWAIGSESTPVEEGYFDQEQVFLYEAFMYYWYFQTPMDHIMNISISDWFTADIDPVLDKVSYFLKLSIDKDAININHAAWIKANNL